MIRILLVFMVAIIGLMSCKSKEKELQISQLSISRDSLVAIVLERDSIMNDALYTISDISATLTAIKMQENIIISSSELNKTPKQQIKEDLEILSKLLKDKKNAISSLNSTIVKLNKKSDLKTDGLNKLIEQLKNDINDRDEQIKILLANIDNLNTKIEELNIDVAQKSKLNQKLDQMLSTASDNLNRVYFATGTEKELLNKGIIVKRGGIGRTLMVNPEIDKSKLIMVDKNNIDRIDIRGKKVEIIGSFPKSSYSLVSGNVRKEIEALIITDKESFWENSKILVISYK